MTDQWDGDPEALRGLEAYLMSEPELLRRGLLRKAAEAGYVSVGWRL
jgi:hypothetical protein